MSFEKTSTEKTCLSFNSQMCKISNMPKKNYKKTNKKKKKAKVPSLLGVFIILLIAIIIGITNGNLRATIYKLLGMNENPSTTAVTTTKTTAGSDSKLELSRCDSDSAILQKTYYTVGYNKNTKQPNWVGYYLSSARLNGGNEERSEDFREDESLKPAWRSLLSDYRRSGYDRGHLAPAADFKFSAEAMSETFYLSNMSPQIHDYNAGIWLTAEKAARKNAYESGDLYIVTGPIFHTDPPASTIGDSKVGVPDAFYKVFLVYNDNEKKGIGLIIPHEKGKFKNLSYYAMSIDDVEKETGIDFFYNLPDNDENKIEASFNVADWVMRDYQF